MYVYISYPYSDTDRGSILSARVKLLEIFGGFVLKNSGKYPINAVFSENADKYHDKYQQLIDQCGVVIIIQEKGWDSCKIIASEVAYAFTKNKPVAFVEVTT